MTDELRDQLLQIEAPVEAVAEGAEVLAGVLAELEGLMRPVDHRFEVTEHRVDPLELRQLTRLAITDDHVRVGATGIDDTGKAVQAIAAHVAARQQVSARPVGDGLRSESAELIDLDEQRATIFAGGHRGHDGHLVGRPTSTNPRPLAAEVSVVELNHALQRGLAVTLAHGGHQLLVNQPGRAVRGTQMALERQGRQPGLGLADQIDRQEPSAKRQLGAVHQSASGQRGLVAAAPALEQLAGAVANDVVFGSLAARTTKAMRPAMCRQGCCALNFGPVAAEEIRQRHPVLELDLVHGHRWLRSVDMGQRTGPVAHRASQAELRD